jgi:DmsE family decaheme c-type cytochrome
MQKTRVKTLWTILLLVLASLATVAVGQEVAGETVESMETCADCHEDEAAAFVAGPHGRLMARQSPATLDASCATCHRGVELHLEEFTVESIERLPSPEACLDCHPQSGAALALSTPAHARHGVACLDCHASGHAEVPAEPLLQALPGTLCGGCHADEKNAFERPFAHREGNHSPLACTTCHSAHDAAAGRLHLLQSGGPCISCHSDKAGPFIFPHAPREVDGCVTCHEPHGSQNPRQLTRRTSLSLCLECHGDVPARSFHDFTQARFRNCQNCHRAVHGSNSDPHLLDD